MNKTFYTGARTLDIPGESRRHFGMVDGYAPIEGPGNIRISLDIRQIQVLANGPFISVKLPEAWATVLAQRTIETATRLEHLRGLYKLGHLDNSALFEVSSVGIDASEEPSHSPMKIDSKENLASFVKLLANELRAGDIKWENSDLQSFLDALAASLADTEHREQRGDTSLEKPSWELLASSLSKATIYK